MSSSPVTKFWQSSSPVAQFWQQLRNSKEERKEAHLFVTLPLNIYWAGVTELGSAMYVRECYERIWRILESDWDQQPSHFLLLGTPGIGKSFFLLYTVYRLLGKLRESRKPFKIVLQMGAEGACHYLLSMGGFFGSGLQVKEIPEVEVHRHIADAENYYLIDSSLPHSVANARTLMVSYPDPKLYDYYDRHSVVKKLYMPTWSLAECQTARKYIYTECDETTFAMNFEKLGGVPRFVLFKPHHLPIEEQSVRDDYVKETLSMVVNSKRAFLASILGDTIFEPNEIVHYEVPALDFTYKKHFVKLATLHVTQIVLRNLSEKQRLEVGRMIKAVAKTHPYAMEKLEFFIQALLLGTVEEWPRRFRLHWLRGLRSFADLASIQFHKLDHVTCGFGRLLSIDDIGPLESERKKKGYQAMWGMSMVPQASGIDGVYLDENHVSLLYMKPRGDRKISAGSVREVMTLFKGNDSRKIWIHNLVPEHQFDDCRPLEYDGYPEEIAHLDDSVAQFALCVTMSMDRTPASMELTEEAVPSLSSPRGGIVE